MFFLLLLAASLVVNGCASSQQQALRTPLVPPTPIRLVDIVASVERPRLGADLYAHSLPAVLDRPPELVVAATKVQSLIGLAEARFQAGRLHYQAGEMDAARAEFDRALDTLLRAPEGLPDQQSVNKKLSELVEEIHRYDVSGLGAGELPSEPAFDKSPLEDIPELTFPIDPKQRNRVAEELRATVSQLPLEFNDEVLRYVDYFSSGRGRKVLIAGLARAGRYRPLIQRILDEEGVPQELIYLAQAESAFSPRAVSRKRATGMWQFMLSRGREYGLGQTRYSDDRLDPEKATRAAARHLRDLYIRFGDWYLAMAAYNCGPLNVQRAIERTGYADFWELRRRGVLPKETLNYIPIILAMTIMAKNPGDYGLNEVGLDPPLEYSTVEIEYPTHLALIADAIERPVAEILGLNPALLKNVAPKGYLLRVPKGTAATVVSALDMIPPQQRAAWRIHRVEEGETLALIARRYRASVKSISEVNQLDGDGTDEGNLLVIPAAQRVPKTVRRASSRTRRSSSSARSTARSSSPPSKSASAKKQSSRSFTQAR